MRHACLSDPTLFCLISLIILTVTPRIILNSKSEVIGKLLNKAYDVTKARTFHYTYPTSYGKVKAGILRSIVASWI